VFPLPRRGLVKPRIPDTLANGSPADHRGPGPPPGFYYLLSGFESWHRFIEQASSASFDWPRHRDVLLGEILQKAELRHPPGPATPVSGISPSGPCNYPPGGFASGLAFRAPELLALVRDPYLAGIGEERPTSHALSLISAAGRTATPLKQTSSAARKAVARKIGWRWDR